MSSVDGDRLLILGRPRSLRWRWQHRRAWRMNLRWAALVLAPFAYVPVIGGLILFPAVALAKALQVTANG